MMTMSKCCESCEDCSGHLREDSEWTRRHARTASDCSADPLLAKRVVSQRVLEGRPALVQNLLAVGHEEKSRAGKLGASRA